MPHVTLARNRRVRDYSRAVGQNPATALALALVRKTPIPLKWTAELPGSALVGDLPLKIHGDYMLVLDKRVPVIDRPRKQPLLHRCKRCKDAPPVLAGDERVVLNGRYWLFNLAKDCWLPG
jgi:hypothetical protein